MKSVTLRCSQIEEWERTDYGKFSEAIARAGFDPTKPVNEFTSRGKVFITYYQED